MVRWKIWFYENWTSFDNCVRNFGDGNNILYAYSSDDGLLIHDLWMGFTEVTHMCGAHRSIKSYRLVKRKFS